MLPLARISGLVEGSELAAEKMDEDVAPGDSAAPDNTIEGNTLYACFFCEKHRKKVKGREEKLSVLLSNSIDSIRTLATQSGDIDMNQRLQQLPLDGEYFYHKSCKNVEQFVAEKIVNQEQFFF